MMKFILAKPDLIKFRGIDRAVYPISESDLPEKLVSKYKKEYSEPRPLLNKNGELIEKNIMFLIEISDLDSCKIKETFNSLDGTYIIGITDDTFQWN